MTTTATSTRKKSHKPATRTAKSVASYPLGSQLLTGKALLVDMVEYRRKVTASPEAARNFLTRLGVMTPSGKVKTLIRG